MVMTKEKSLEQLIQETRPQYQDKNTVSFLGKVSSGKTVSAALLKHTLSKFWIPDSKGKWEAVVSSGYEEINAILLQMKKGMFPAATPKENYPKLVIDIYNMQGNPVKKELVLHDMSGENYIDLLTTSNLGAKERLAEILSGNGAHIAYAKKYVIVIDCEEREDWDVDIAKVSHMLGRLKEIKQIIHNFGSDEQLHTPISIVFTKSDVLSNDDQKKPAEELAKDYPELLSSLKINHDGKSLCFFKMFVASKLESQEEAQTRVKNKDLKLRKEFEEQKKSRENQIETTIKQSVGAAVKQAREEGQNEENIRNISKDTRQRELAKYQEQLEPSSPLLTDREAELIPQSKIDVPLSYAASEYSKLISWIVDEKNDE